MDPDPGQRPRPRPPPGSGPCWSPCPRPAPGRHSESSAPPCGHEGTQRTGTWPCRGWGRPGYRQPSKPQVDGHFSEYSIALSTLGRTIATSDFLWFSRRRCNSVQPRLRAMIRCSACGRENPRGSTFCNACGSALAAAPMVDREERKFVTVLFADLVGFTSRAERMDPEDVRAMLTSYHERVRSELERRGGRTIPNEPFAPPWPFETGSATRSPTFRFGSA